MLILKKHAKRSGVLVFKFSIVSFFVLGFTVINLFFLSFVTSVNEGHNVLGFFKFVILMLMGYEIKNEWIKRIGRERAEILEAKFEYEDFISIAMVVIGTLVSFALHNELGLQAVASSSVVGLVSAIVLPRYQIPLYCGSFAGMASIEVFSRYETVLVAGVVAGLTLVATKPIFKGFGGKLGISAFVGTMVTSLIFGKFSQGQAELSIRVSDWIILYFILGATLTFMIDERKRIGAVASSSIMGLIGSVFLPLLYGSEGDIYSVAVFCGSFIGMTSLERIKKRRFMIVAGVFGSIIFVYTNSLYAGLGGKLGAIAFGSTIAMAGLIDLSKNVLEIKGKKM